MTQFKKNHYSNKDSLFETYSVLRKINENNVIILSTACLAPGLEAYLKTEF